MKQFIICIFLISSLVSCKKEVQKKAAPSVKPSEKITAIKKEIPISKEETELLRKLMNEDLRPYKKYGQNYMNFNEYPYSLSFTDEVESRSTINYSIMASDDLNDDGVKDYIVSKLSDGTAGSYFVFVIMKDKYAIKEMHEVLEYAPFSYNSLDEIQYKDKKIKTTVTKNPRAYDIYDESAESIDLVFSYQNGNLYEKSYLSKCKMAELESKTIFNDIPHISRRVRDIDIHNYTETITEAYLSKDTLMVGALSGCDNLILEFDITVPIKKQQKTQPDFVKNSTLFFLSFLADKTQFTDDINPILEYVKENGFSDKEKIIDENLVFALNKSYLTDGKMEIRIAIERRTNPNQIENWEIASRKK